MNIILNAKFIIIKNIFIIVIIAHQIYVNDCQIYHDNNHNIFQLSNIFLKEEEIEYITKKYIEYNNIILHYKHYISLNNLILDTYKNLLNNFNCMKNLINIIRFQKSLEINNNSLFKLEKYKWESIGKFM